MSTLNEEIVSSSESLNDIQEELRKTLETYDRLEAETSEKKEAESKLSEKLDQLLIEQQALRIEKPNWKLLRVDLMRSNRR